MNRTQLRQILATRFDAVELRTLCFELDVEYGNLPGRSKAEKVIELINHLERRNRLLDLVKVGKRLRPDISWGDTPTVPGPPQAMPSNVERDSLRAQLDMAQKVLAVYEQQAAGYTTLTIPALLVVNLQEEMSTEPIRREYINDIYRQAAENEPDGYLFYTEKQNVSGDIIGIPRAAAIIEGHETHRRTAEVTIDLAKIPGLDACVMDSMQKTIIRVPVTQAVIYGWYDNEMGSYVNMLGDRTISIAETM